MRTIKVVIYLIPIIFNQHILESHALQNPLELYIFVRENQGIFKKDGLHIHVICVKVQIDNS
jgi:hypothetical protein